MRPLRLGTRGSTLARRQTAEAIAALAAHGVAGGAVITTTQGDRDRSTPLTDLGGLGVFAREIERALLRDEVDVAVHSAKDLPTALLEETVIAAFLPRADARDALVGGGRRPLAALRPGARVGSSSRRRSAQIRVLRPDLVVAPIRGNVETRIAKVQRGEYDATVLAVAGLTRLGRIEEATEIFATDAMLPAPGQGAIALQARAADAPTLAALVRVNHPPTEIAVRAERALLGAFGAGCSLPIAALGRVTAAELRLSGLIADEPGERVVRAEQRGPVSDPEGVGKALAEALLGQGADALLREVVS